MPVIFISVMSGRQDYTRGALWISILVIVFLSFVAFVPGFKVGSVSIKRANIFSDVVDIRDGRIVPVSGTSAVDCMEDTAAREEMPLQEAEEPAGGESPELPGGEEPVIEEGLPVPQIDDDSLVQIEDFSAGKQMTARFYHALAYESAYRPVRIAVLGDSFIEADIITADMREQLQTEYGGSGVGFVPFSTPLSKYRGTVSHNHDGWTDYNLIRRKSVPEEYKGWFFVSGMLSIPAEGAHTEYRGVKFRRRIEETGTASLYFVNRGHTVLDVAVNGAPARSYAPAPSDSVQRIFIQHPGISSVSVKVTDTEGFIGYGVVLEDTVGVSVHNFSVRSNSGLALLNTSREVNRQFSDYFGYDMVILQYGLNAMSADVTEYGYYSKQLVRIIDYVKECFPGSAVVVMSVGDRSTMKNGTAVTMPAVMAMLKAQKVAAEACGVGFWNTYEAMGGDNSMPGFVERNWAAKDYTHIGYPGGKYIAGRFVSFIKAAVESVRSQDAERALAAAEAAAEAERVRREQALLDAARILDVGIVSDSIVSEVERASDGKYSFAIIGNGAGDDTTGVRLRDTIATDTVRVKAEYPAVMTGNASADEPEDMLEQAAHGDTAETDGTSAADGGDMAAVTDGGNAGEERPPMSDSTVAAGVKAAIEAFGAGIKGEGN